jgi:hypothetical protein
VLFSYGISYTLSLLSYGLSLFLEHSRNKDVLSYTFQSFERSINQLRQGLPFPFEPFVRLLVMGRYGNASLAVKESGYPYPLQVDPCSLDYSGSHVDHIAVPAWIIYKIRHA